VCAVPPAPRTQQNDTLSPTRVGTDRRGRVLLSSRASKQYHGFSLHGGERESCPKATRSPTTAVPSGEVCGVGGGGGGGHAQVTSDLAPAVSGRTRARKYVPCPSHPKRRDADNNTPSMYSQRRPQIVPPKPHARSRAHAQPRHTAPGGAQHKTHPGPPRPTTRCRRGPTTDTQTPLPYPTGRSTGVGG
jgi:hypothetical protein